MQVVGGIKEIRGQIKDVNISYKIMVAEHREYERAVQAYERKVEPLSNVCGLAKETLAADKMMPHLLSCQHAAKRVESC